MDNSESNSQPEFREDEIAESMVEMLEHVQQLDNEEMPNACNVEDWLNLQNELPTSPQMSDKEILAAVVGRFVVSTKEAAQCFKSKAP